MILLGVGAFVIDVQARDNSFSDNARAASAVGYSRFLQLTAKEQLHLFSRMTSSKKQRPLAGRSQI